MKFTFNKHSRLECSVKKVLFTIFRLENTCDKPFENAYFVE